jgi:hypothetical protein
MGKKLNEVAQTRHITNIQDLMVFSPPHSPGSQGAKRTRGGKKIQGRKIY